MAPAKHDLLGLGANELRECEPTKRNNTHHIDECASGR
jgi:hypothetical protein